MRRLSIEAARASVPRRIRLPGRTTVLLMLSLTALGSCGGRDGVSPPTKGSLALTVAGVPAGAENGWQRSMLETSQPGIFAVGDVRAGSAKRVAAAVGEGAMAIRLAFERMRPT